MRRIVVQNTLFAVLSIGLIQLAMSTSLTLNPGALERFKQRINYPAIVQPITDDAKVIIDWPQLFKAIQLPDGAIWKSYVNSSGIQNAKQGSISDFFEHDEKTIHITVDVYTHTSNSQVIEQAMLQSSFTSMPDIALDYDQHGPGDFYLYRTYTTDHLGDRRAIGVYQNVILNISQSGGEVDVRPIAAQLVNLMSQAVVPTANVPNIAHTLVFSAQKIRPGETFWVEIAFPAPATSQDYQIKLQTTPLPDGLEYIDLNAGKYYLKANKPGVYQFQIWLMDKRTLLTTPAEIMLNITDE